MPSLRAEAVLARRLDAARDLLAREAWLEATDILQSLLDTSEDALVPVKHAGTDGKEVTSWTGLRAEAARLLGTLPAAGRKLYEARYGPRARAGLVEARDAGDADLVAEVVRRYPHTAAGIEGLTLLGSYHLDRARYLLAACCFECLLDRAGTDDLPPAVLFHAALAFRRAGITARAEQTWQRVIARAPAGLRLGGRSLSLADLKRILDRDEPQASAPPAASPPAVANLEPCWSRPTTHEDVTRTWLKNAVQAHEIRGQPVVPASFPVLVAGRAIYRSCQGLHALDVATGAEAWATPSGWSMDHMALQPRYASYLEAWVNAYLDVSPHVLFENAVLGTLSTDGSRVYAVDDLAVPPYRNVYRGGGRFHPDPLWPDFGPNLNDATIHSRLVALDAATGKPVWEAGGLGDEAGELSGAYFLGPPLPLDGHLYVITERINELSLACLSAGSGTQVWKQALAFPPTRLLLDPGRRIQAARPVYADGLLVCPTNAGVVAGVDVLTRSLAWAYPYRGEALTQAELAMGGRRGRMAPPRATAEWKAPVTVIHGGRIVFTAPDEASVHCLNLRDGSLCWKVERADDDVYLAGVVADRVLVVGKQSCRALDLADGKQLWQVETGLPSGRGVAGGDVYYLPLKEAGKEKEPVVTAIDVRRGTVQALASWPRKEVPGNLLFADGQVFSQTATAVTAYPKKAGSK
jgi:outer membrane protein assembly factor BamB